MYAPKYLSVETLSQYGGSKVQTNAPFTVTLLGYYYYYYNFLSTFFSKLKMYKYISRHFRYFTKENSYCGFLIVSVEVEATPKWVNP